MQIERIQFNFEPVGIRNTGSYYTLTERPVLTLNIEHGFTDFRTRERITNLVTQNPLIVLSDVIYDFNRKNLIVCESDGNYLANFNLTNPTLTTTKFYSTPKRLGHIYFSNAYFIYDLSSDPTPTIYRLNSDNTIVADPYTYPNNFTPYRTVGTYNKRLYLADKNEPVVAYSNVLSVSGALTKDDFWGVASNAPVIAIFDVSLQTIGDYKSFLTLVQADGTTLLYSGAYPGSNDFSLAYKLKVPALVTQIAPFRVGTDLFLVTSDGLFSLKALLGSTGEDIYSLNILQSILPLYYTLLPFIVSGGFLENKSAVYLVFNKAIDIDKPFRTRPNSPAGDLEMFRLRDGSTIILYNLLLKTISVYVFNSANSLNDISCCLDFFETENDVYLADFKL